MSKRGSHFSKLILATAAFFAVYVTIHYLLNVYGQSATALSANVQPQGAELSESAKLVVNLAGPITIGMCSSLLILSFGSFMIHGLKDITISAPWAFSNAFVIFVFGQILVQITGHTEIYLLNSNVDLKTAHWITFALLSSCYPVAFLTLFLLEWYHVRVYDSLNRQLPEPVRLHANDARALKWTTLGSVLLLVLKPLVLQFDYDAKFSVSVFALVIESALAIFVILRLFQANNRENQQHGQAS